MNRRGRSLARLAFAVFELGLTAGAFAAAVAIRRRLELPILQEDFREAPLWSLLWPALAVWAPFLWAWGLSRSGREGPLHLLWNAVKVVAAGTVVLLAATFLLHLLEVSRFFIALFGVLDLAALAGARLAAASVRHYARKQGHDRTFVLVAGTGAMARRHAGELESHPEWGTEVLGYLTERPEVRLDRVGDRPVLGSLDDLDRLLNQKIVDEVHIAVSRRTLERLDEPLRICDERGVEVRIVLTQLNRLNSRVYLDRMGGLPVLALASTPQEPVSLLLKRAMDIAVSLVALLIAGPLILLPAMLLVKLTSRGPAVFRQKRVGRHGRLFTLYKIRTMREDAERLKESLKADNEADGPAFKIRNDPRMTGVGRILRKLSVDELPQLWNVLRGDMSLVGPRPPLPDEVARYERWQRRRLAMRPGITCIWQVSGRSGVSFQRWMEMDLEYIDNWSLGLDLKILLKTIPAVFTARGAA